MSVLFTTSSLYVSILMKRRGTGIARDKIASWYIYKILQMKGNSVRYHLLIAAIILSVIKGYSQDKTPKYANEFLTLGVGARGFGMSKAQVAVTNDVTSAYWNPAGLSGMQEKYQFSLMHAELFAGIAKYDYLGFSMKIDSMSALGVSLIRFGIDDIPDTRFLYDANGAINYDNIRFFSAADYALLLSYSRKMGFLPGLSLGANFKVIYRNVGSFANAWGFGLDAGGKYIIKGWKFGVMLRDITGTFTAWYHNTDEIRDIYAQTGNIIPETSLEITLPRLIIGAGKRFVIKNDWGIQPAIDLIMTFDGKRNVLLKSQTISIEPVFGLETDFRQLAFLRLGVGNVQQVKNFDASTYTEFQPTFGLGIRLKQVDVDYALTDLGNQSDALYSHIFSISVRLDK